MSYVNVSPEAVEAVMSGCTDPNTTPLERAEHILRNSDSGEYTHNQVYNAGIVAGLPSDFHGMWIRTLARKFKDPDDTVAQREAALKIARKNRVEHLIA